MSDRDEAVKGLPSETEDQTRRETPAGFFHEGPYTGPEDDPESETQSDPNDLIFPEPEDAEPVTILDAPEAADEIAENLLRQAEARFHAGPIPVDRARVNAEAFQFGTDDEERPDDEDDDPDRPRTTAETIASYPVITRDTARRRMDQEAKGYWFLLRNTRHPDTQEPQRIYVRRVTLLDRATIGNLPRQLQERIIAITRAAATNQGDQEKIAKVQQVMRNLGRSEEVADAYMVAAAIEPRVYASLDEADRLGGLWVKEIDINDRHAFVAACDGMTREAVALLTPFLGGTLVELGSRSNGQDVAGSGKPEPSASRPANPGR